MRSGGPSPHCPRLGLLSFLPPSLSPLSPAARPHSKVARHLLPPAATSSTMTSWSAAGSATGNGTWSASARTAAGGAALPVGLAGQPQVVTAHSSAAILPPHLDTPHRIYAAEPCCPHRPGHAASPCRRVECKVDPPSAGDRVESLHATWSTGRWTSRAAALSMCPATQTAASHWWRRSSLPGGHSTN